MIKQRLADTIVASIRTSIEQGDLVLDQAPSNVSLERSRQTGGGAWTTDIAVLLAQAAGEPVDAVAAAILCRLPDDPGEIRHAVADEDGNIVITPGTKMLGDIVREIGVAGDRYGRSEIGDGRQILVEFVSANPNGPITIAHGRNAALGDAIAALLSAVGFRVTREHYVNDALSSKQMSNFGRSVLLRYLQILGRRNPNEDTEGLDWLYRGDYVNDIARHVIDRVGDRYQDASIENVEIVKQFRAYAQEAMLIEQQETLHAFGVVFDSYFNESSLYGDGRIDATVAELTDKGHTYRRDGALWFRSTTFGDENDRVLLRADGSPTYMTGDAAYHRDKFDRGFDRAIDVWGADHAGYIARTKAVLTALGYDPDRLEIRLYQGVRIIKYGAYVKASKRRSDFLELKADLIDEIGADAARFFLLMRWPQAELDIDLDLARRTDNANPYFRVRSACDRLSGAAPPEDDPDYAMLTRSAEIGLIEKLAEYPETVRSAALDRAPHLIVAYVTDLAAVCHIFCDEDEVSADHSAARSFLASSARATLGSALSLLGVAAPERR